VGVSEHEQNERERLAKMYAAMADGELLKLAEERDELTEEARGLLEAELGRRNVAPEPNPAETELVVEQRRLEVVERFRDLAPALLAKGLLEANGIECFLGNENMVRMDWYISNLLGGIMLRVPEEDLETARELLERPPEDFETDSGPYEQPQCSECGSTEVSLNEGFEKGASLAALAIAGVPLPVGEREQKCARCGHTWRAEAEQDSPRE
jgi:hypothetical protein